jgi:3-phenylpropionate/trans-cinnamate dioxygenase ferredoxin reductase component
MPKRVERIVVVGAGDCGTRAALALRQNGFADSVTLVGDEAGDPYERPPLSKALLDDHDTKPIASANELRTSNITLARGAASCVDQVAQTVSLDDGTALPYDRLLIATGARARRPPVDGAEHVLTLRNAVDATRLREQLRPGCRLLIVGGGFIGLEIAANAAVHGCSVTVLEFAHRLMSRVVPNRISEAVLARHLQAGVDIRFGIGVDRIEKHGDAFEVRLIDGSSMTVDVVMAGVGAVPNTELAAAAGLTIDNGIAVDARLRTSDSNIYAAGDCCSFPHALYGGVRVRIEAWRNALDHADIAARNLLGEDAVYERVPWFWSDQYELGLQIAGLYAQSVYEVVRTSPDGHDIGFALDHDGRVVAASGIAEGTTIGRDISLAEMLIAARATPRPALLGDPSVPLRDLLHASTGR